MGMDFFMALMFVLVMILAFGTAFVVAKRKRDKK
jgi:hypothetical protein